MAKSRTLTTTVVSDNGPNYTIEATSAGYIVRDDAGVLILKVSHIGDPETNMQCAKLALRTHAASGA